jgi:hypothetical protein
MERLVVVGTNVEWTDVVRPDLEWLGVVVRLVG